jgi:hypothetical protein
VVRNVPRALMMTLAVLSAHLAAPSIARAG